ncbi:MAG: hypothetical protein IH984_16390 [Planctomycetes bacterium]|nr:hypothetical protein [Planctomycetota bacterium]
MSETARLIIWAHADQQMLIKDMLRKSKAELIAVGSPQSTDAAELAENLKTDRLKNLREAILHEKANLLWLAAPSRLEVDERRLIREVGITTISSEPRPGSISELTDDPDEAKTARFVALMRQSPGYRAAQEVFDQLGPRQCVNVSMRSGAGQGTLFARLFDAIDMIDTLCGDAQLIDASLAGLVGATPESLAGLHGHMTLNMRFSNNCCACVALSDCAGSWFRGVTIMAEGGCLRLDDAGFEWTSQDGDILDSHREKKALSPGQLIAIATTRLIDKHNTAEAPPDNAKLLAVCEAARLSCRTGQGEAPRRMLEMLSRP